MNNFIRRMTVFAGRILRYIDARRPLRVLWKTANDFVDDGCLDNAAALSFYALLSFIPFLIIVGAVMGWFVDYLSGPQDASVREMTEAVKLYLKTAIPYLKDEQIVGFINLSGHTASLSTVGFVSLAISASLLFSTLSETLSRIFGSKRIHFVFTRLIGFLVIVALTILLFFLHYFSAMALSIVSILRTEVPLVEPFLDFFTGAGILWSIPLITLIILLFFSALVHSFALTAHIRFTATVSGALLFSALWNGAKYLFNVYITKLSSYSILYGSATWLAATILWIYYSILLLLFSMEFVKALDTEIREKTSNGN